MAESWASLGIDLHLERSGPGLRAGLTAALREAVRGGRLAPGTRLPSSRALAADLGIARNTVAESYADLVAEGWLTARQGSGTRVADQALPPPPARPRARALPSRPAHDLRPGFPDLSSFPRAAWLRAARHALTHAPNDAFGYGDSRGRPELREALAEYLARVRGVRTDPDRIVVCSGFAHALVLLDEVLRRRGVREVAVERYSVGIHRDLLERGGLRTRPLPFDELGTDTGPLRTWDAGAVLVTSAHQFPMGLPLHPDRRAEALAWARAGGGVVLEDDYDGEFRYDRQAVGALQGLDPERVVYLGTASKSLAPGLRLGWMVLPHPLADEVAAAKGDGDWTCATPDQLTLARFLRSGDYDRHVRAMRQRYRRRRDQLVAALAVHAPGVRPRGIAAGLHAVLELPPGTEQSVLRAAAWQGLALTSLRDLRHPEADPAGTPGALVVGYGTPAEHAWPGALEALCRALG